MKKLFPTAAILIFLLALFPAITSANAGTYPLYAGQDMLVGQVNVRNTEDTLFVQFHITEAGWCLQEAHVELFMDTDTFSDVPQKNGNPIPGKFEINKEYALYPCVKDSPEYSFPLPEGEIINIAAHAAIVRPVEGCYEQVWQIGDVEVVNPEMGWLENYADEFNWEYPAGPITVGPSLTASQPAFADPFIVGVTPTSEFPYNSNTAKNYATDFDVQWTGALPFGGKLTVSWSPGQSAAEKKIITASTATTVTATGSPQPGQGWFMNKYPLVEDIVPVDPAEYDTQTIRFQHTQGDGTFWDWVRLEKPCIQEESAWAGTNMFPGKNWATYFTYAIQPVLIETFSVSAKGTPSCTTDPLILGEAYTLKASGTYFYRTDGISEADAEWAYRKPGEGLGVGDDEWVKGDVGTDVLNPYSSILGLDVSKYIGPSVGVLASYENIDWGDYSAQHNYATEYAGDGATLCLGIYDSNFSDNSGSIAVELWWHP